MHAEKKQKSVYRDRRTMVIKIPVSAWGVILAVCASFTTYVHAKDSVECRQLNAATNGPDDNFRPPVSATVTGQGRAYFYSAPSPQCITKRTFIVPGNIVTVYKPYKRWYQVMYENNNTGEDVEGWVEEGRLRLDGHLGGDQ